MAPSVSPTSKPYREQPELFGDVASVSTAWRAVKATACLELRRIPKAVAVAREIVWAEGATGRHHDRLRRHAAKRSLREARRSAYLQEGVWLFPIGAWCDTTGEPLAAMLRPGNAGANDAEDHLELLDQAVAGLPGDYQVGHEPGDDPSLVRHHILVRADSAGASRSFVSGLVEANIEYSIGHQVSAKVREALLLFQEEDWVQAIEADGTVREGAFLAELTPLMDLSSWGEGARLIIRRERPHPGAQLSLFDMSEGYRHTCFITNAPDNDGDDAVLRAAPPRSRTSGGPDTQLEGLWASQPAVRQLHPEPRLGGHKPRRRFAARLGADDLFGR